MKPVTLLLIAGGVGLAFFAYTQSAAAAEASSQLPVPPQPRTVRRRERRMQMPTDVASVKPSAPPEPPKSVEPAKPKVKVYPALESPGGGRIKDNSELKPADRIMVQAPDSKGPKKPLHKEAAAAYLDMIEAARAAGIKAPLLEINSGYRSDAEQKAIWDKKMAESRARNPGVSDDELKKRLRKYVALPGSSNHRTGRTVDLNMGFEYLKILIPKMQASPQHKWLVENAAKFGFYPYEVEPWHWEYNPPKAA